MRKSLSHEIRKHILRRAIFHIDRSLFDMIADKVKLNVDVFCFRVMYRISLQVRLRCCYCLLANLLQAKYDN